MSTPLSHGTGTSQPLPHGTVTFLFTDIEGSTRLLHALGPDAYAVALSEHRRVLRESFAIHGGVEVDTQGDAFFVAFPTAPGAVAAALAGQGALEPGPIRVRMGLHTGAPTVTPEGYVGIDVHRGARVAALAHGGQVLLTDATQALLPVGEELADLGLHRMKDFGSAVRVFQLGSAPYPPLRTPGAVDLPVPATRFVGREHELFDAVSTWLERRPRVLTVVGPGGTGKTRFALELARLLAEEADGGTLFVPLAPVRDPDLVLPTIAERLGASSSEPSAIAARVGGRWTHVLLDNLEQLLPDAARPLAELVAAAPTLRLLATSREPLRIAGETELDLPPMDDEDGAALFLERAHSIRPDLADTPAVHELVRRLDGLPLALELAAARVKLLAPEQLLDRLGQRLDLLTGSRDSDERHATLRATIAWSHDLLDEGEQQLFARLAVFRGGFRLEVVEEVCDASLDGLASLLDKSLVRRRTDADGTERFWMLETIREFARERLHELPLLDERVRRRHAEWILTVARAAHLSSEDQGREKSDHERVLAEREEIRAALDWAAEHDRLLGAEIVVALEAFWATHAIREGRRQVERLLDDPRPLPPPLRARLLRLLGGNTILVGEVDLGEAHYREALALFRELGDEDNVVALLARFAVDAGWRATVEEARRLVAEVRTLNETVRNPMVEPQMLSTLAQVAHREGDLPTAVEQYRRAVEAARACGFTMWTLWSLENLMEVELELGRLDDAERTGRDAVALATRLQDRRVTVFLLTGLALAALGRGELERAGTLWGAVLDAEEKEPFMMLDTDPPELSAPLSSCQDVGFWDAVDAGRVLTLGQAVSLSLGEAQTEP